MKTLNELILDWIGRDIIFISREEPLENVKDCVYSYNKALLELRARVPELAHTISKHFEKKLTKILLDNVVFIQDHGQYIKTNIINSLTSE